MKPEIHSSSFVSKNAVIIGNVKIGKNCGIYPCAVIRGDENSIIIGDGSNIQDCCVIHTDANHTVRIGNNVSIGHSAMIHGATIEDDCLIGINSTVLNGAKIGKGSIIGANALVKEYMQVPENSLVIGIPGKVIKQDKEIREKARLNAVEYRRISKSHMENKHITFRKK
jgi:carbonic anhydrase/acetyltransferase-like protein (isoleucine patch superfamily)